MCRKQCRDQNGFDMHCQGRAHCEQMALFAKNPDRYINEFSTEFRSRFLEVLEEKHAFAETKAAVPYNQLLGSDSQCARLSATRWSCLAHFISSLEEDGICKVRSIDDAVSGQPIQFIRLYDKRNEEAHKKMLAKRERDAHMRQENETELESQFAARHAAIAALGGKKPSSTAEPLLNTTTTASSMKMNLTVAKETSEANIFTAQKELRRNEREASRREAEEAAARKEKKRRVEVETATETDPIWVTPGIVVKVVNQAVGGGRFFKKKGKVEATDGYTATVRIAEPSAVLKLDQQDLQTVIPKLGNTVLLLQGRHKGSRAVLDALNAESFSAVLSLGKSTVELPYEHFSKLSA